jgi:hypothetical protein
MHTKFWYENLKGGDCLEDLTMDERIIIKFMCVHWALESLDPEDKGTKILQNTGEYLPDIAQYPIRLQLLVDSSGS